MRLGILAAHKIEYDGRLTAIGFPPRITYVHDLKHTGDADARTFKGLVARSLLCLLDELCDPLRFFLLIVFIERLAVVLNLALDQMPAHEEVFVLRGLGLLYLPVRVDVLYYLPRGIRIVLADFVELFLVLLHLVHELANLGQGFGGSLLAGRTEAHEQYNHANGQYCVT